VEEGAESKRSGDLAILLSVSDFRDSRLGEVNETLLFTHRFSWFSFVQAEGLR
jgi:hypothetical protein